MQFPKGETYVLLVFWFKERLSSSWTIQTGLPNSFKQKQKEKRRQIIRINKSKQKEKELDG